MAVHVTRRHFGLRLQTLESRDAPAAFTPGNLVVYRVGTGGFLTAGGTAVFLDEYTAAAGQSAAVQSVPMPTAVSGSNRRLVAGGTAELEGLLTRSADGRHLVLTGYDAAVDAPTPAANGNLRTVGRVDAAGHVDTTTAVSDGFTGAGSAIRSAVSLDGAGYWTSGEGSSDGGVRYVGHGAATSVQVTAVPSNGRQLGIFNNQLYVSSFTASKQLTAVGPGVPTTAGQTAVAIPGYPATGSPAAFHFADLDGGVAGVDTLYVASPTSDALAKFSLVGGTWTANGVVGVAGDGYRGLTAAVAGTSVTLYAVRGGNQLVKLTDASGYNGAFAGTPVVLATAANNTAFRGVAFAPLAAGPPNTAPTLDDIANPAAISEDAAAQTVMVSGITTGSEGGQTVTVTAASGNSQLIGAVTVTGSGTTGTLTYTPVPDASGTAVITVTVQDNGGTADGGADTVSKTFTVTVNPVNDAPVNHPPAPQTVAEDTPLVFTAANGLTVSDVDAAAVSLTLTATNGLLDLGSTAGLTVTGNHSAVVTLAGPLAAVNDGLHGLTFTPLPDSFGPASIRMETDDGSLADNDIFAVTVSPLNDAPTLAAIPDPPTITEDAGEQTVTVAGLTPGPANEAGQSLSVTATSGNPDLIAAIAVSGSGTTRTLAFTPTANASGAAVITVRVQDDGAAGGGHVNTAETAFTVTVLPANDAPAITLPETFAALEDTQITLTGIAVIDEGAGTNNIKVTFSVTSGTLQLNDVVPGGLTGADISGLNTATVTVTSWVAKIAATLAADGVLFHPSPDANGPVTLTITADDADLATSANSTIAVSPVNDSPTLAAIADPAPVAEDSGHLAVTIFGLSAGPANEAGQVLTVTATSGNTALVSTVSVSEVGNTRELTFTPVPNAFGTAVITVRVEDDGDGMNFSETSFTVVVNPVNDPPTLADVPDPEPINEDAGEQTVTVAGISGGPGELVQAVSVTATSDSPALVSMVAVSGTGGARTLRYSPTPNANGVAVVTVRVEDDNGLVTEKSFTVAVHAVNDPPTLDDIPDPTTVAEDVGEQTVILGGISAGPADEAGQTVTVTATSSDPNLISAVSVSGGAVTYTPVPDAHGTAVITVRAQDDGAGTNVTEKTFTVSVLAVNDPPSFTEGIDQVIEEDSGPRTINGWATDIAAGPADEAAQALIFDVTTDNEALFSQLPNVSPDGTLRYTAAANANGTATAYVTLTDSEGGSSITQPFSITVTAMNDAPTMADIPSPPPINEDAAEQAVALSGITAGPADEIGQIVTLTATSGNPALIASAAVIGDGPTRQVIFTPVPDANGTAVITVRVQDDAGGTNVLEKTFTVIVLAVNDPPRLDDINDPPSILEDAAEQSVTITNLSGGPADEAGQPLAVTATSNMPSLIAAVSVSGSGPTRQLTYTPAPDANGVAVITVRVQDDGPGMNVTEKTFVVAVSAVNDVPVATAGDLLVTEDTPTAGALAATDADDDALTFAVVDQPDHGTVSVNSATGAYTYTPAPNYSGPDGFTFRTTDGSADSNTATVNISVIAVNDRPVIDTTPGIVMDRLPVKALDPAGISVESLLTNATDADGSPVAVAVTAAVSSALTGQWQHKLNGAAVWTAIPGASDATPLLLTDPAARVRFVPAAKFTGFASLSYKAWDGAAFSTATEKAWVAVGRTTPAIDAAGNPLLTPILKNAENLAGNAVKSLLGTLATDVNSTDKIGMAVTGVESVNGVWEYKFATKWVAISGVAESSALLLGPTAKIRFRPNPDFFGSATLTYRAWDGAAGKVGERANAVGAAFSTEDDTAVINVISRPSLDTSPLKTLNTTAAVSNLLAGAVTETLPGTSVGIAVTRLTGRGVWSYQIGAGPLTAVPKVSMAKALLLPGDANLSFAPANGFNGVATSSYRAWDATALPAAGGTFGNVSNTAFSAETETLSAVVGTSAPPTLNATTTFDLGSIIEDAKTNRGRAVTVFTSSGIAVTTITGAGTWQFSLDKGKTWRSVGAVTATNALLLAPTGKVRFVSTTNRSGPARVTVRAWDGIYGTSGDYADPTSHPAFSTAAAVGTLTVTPVNDLPVMDAAGVKFLPGITSGTSSAMDVSTLVSGATDADPGALGIAVTAVTGNGTWQFSADDMSDFEPLPKLPAILPSTAAVRFVAATGFVGVARLTYRAADADGALSRASETLSVAVGNDQPTLPAAGTLTALTEDQKVNRGDSVEKLLTTFSDTPNGKKGVAIIGTGGGAWQFSTNGGKSWKTITGVTPASALLLSDANRVRFVPAKDDFSATGAEPAITYLAWDQTVGAVGEMIDTTVIGLDSFSAPVTAKITVSPVADAPTLDTTGTPTLAPGLAGGLVSAFLTGTVSDPEGGSFGIALTGVTGKGMWDVSPDGVAEFEPLGTVSVKAAKLLPATAKLRFRPADGFIGKATLTYKAWNTIGTDAASFSAASETLTVLIGDVPPKLIDL